MVWPSYRYRRASTRTSVTDRQAGESFALIPKLEHVRSCSVDCARAQSAHDGARNSRLCLPRMGKRDSSKHGKGIGDIGQDSPGERESELGRETHPLIV